MIIEKANQNRYKMKMNNVIFIYLLAVIALLSLTAILSIASQSVTMLTLFAVAYLVIITLPILLTRFDWTHPLVLAMPFTFMQGISIFLMSVDILPFSTNFAVRIGLTSGYEAIYLKTIFINSLGYIVMYLFCFGPKVTLNKKKSLSKTWSVELKSNLNLAALIVMGITLASYGYIVFSTFGSVIEMFSDVQNRDALYENLRYPIYLSRYGIVAAILFFYNRNKLGTIVSILIQVIIVLSLGDRGDILFFIAIPFALAYHFDKKPVNLKKILIFGMIFMVFYQLAGEFRLHGETKSSAFSFVQFAQNTFGGIKHHQITAGVVNAIDNNYIEYLKGVPLFNILYAPIPRSIWAAKPTFIAESALVGSLLLGPNYYGLPPGMAGYGYINFGYFGVVTFSAISGWLVKLYHSKLIGDHIKRATKIPRGNILIYAFTSTLVTQPLSTEVQIKVLMFIAFFSIIYILSKNK